MPWILAPLTASAWLLLAGAQSSSTATADQLGFMVSMTDSQEYNQCSSIVGSHYYALRGHSDMCNGIRSTVNKWVARSPNHIYKSHLPPTETNIDLVLAPGKPVVVLTREARASVHGLCERDRSEHKISCTGPCTGGAQLRWAKPFRPYPTIRDTEVAMNLWNENWSRVAAEHSDLILHITFEEMVLDREGVLQRALEHWGITQVKPFVNVYDRYVHHDSVQCSPWGTAAAPSVPPAPTSLPWTPRQITSLPWTPRQILFVTGLPRSGTTLLERFIALHTSDLMIPLANSRLGTQECAVHSCAHVHACMHACTQECAVHKENPPHAHTYVLACACMHVHVHEENPPHAHSYVLACLLPYGLN